MAQIVLVRGKAGTGKTTISTHLASRLGAVLLRKDDIYDVLAEAVATHDARNAACYAILRRIIETNARGAGTVIVDAPFNNGDEVRAFAAWVTAQGAGFRSILCVCSDECLWADRFNRRRHDTRPNNLITDFAALQRHYGDVPTEPLDGELILDAVRSEDALVATALCHLASG